MLFTDSVDGVTTQSGYDIVRAGQTIVVVGSTGNARLDSAALGRVTALAVDKLGRR
jgi:hypothetical protein